MGWAPLKLSLSALWHWWSLAPGAWPRQVKEPCISWKVENIQDSTCQGSAWLRLLSCPAGLPSQSGLHRIARQAASVQSDSVPPFSSPWLQAAKSLGTSLRGVAPFVKEIAGAGTELKRALEEEIGLDDIRNEWRGQGPYPGSSPLKNFQGQAESKPPAAKEAAVHDSGTASPASQGAEAPKLTQVTESMAKTVDPQIDQKRKASEAAAWGSSAPAAAQEEEQQPTKGEASSLQGLSMEDLEAELARRKQERQKAQKA